MSSSLREQILARIATLLTGNTPAGVHVYRSREISITRAEAPAIVVMPRRTELTRVATLADRHALDVAVEIFTRGDPWDSLADAVDVVAHPLIMADATLAQLVADVRRIAEDFESQEADRTAGTLTVTYRVIYLAVAGDIARAA